MKCLHVVGPSLSLRLFSVCFLLNAEYMPGFMNLLIELVLSSIISGFKKFQ